MKKLSPKIITLHNQFSRYGRNAREWMRKCVLLLPEIERNRVWEKKGFFSIYEYAAKLAGMSRETVNDSLRVLKKIEDKPELIKVVEQKGINCIKPIVNMVNEQNQNFWANKARVMSKNTLHAYAKAFREEERRAGPLETENETIEIKMQLPKEMAEQLHKLKGQSEWKDLMKEFLQLREEKLEQLKKDANEKFEEIETQKTQKAETKAKSSNKKTKTIASSRYVPSKIQKYSFYKTNNTCAFPGCTKPAENLHHADRFAITHKHDPEKIIPLCQSHHNLVHDGLIENEERSPSEWRVRCADNANGSQLARQVDYKSVIDQQVAEYRRL